MTPLMITAPPVSVPGTITTPIWVLLLTIGLPLVGVMITAYVSNRASSRQSKVSEREANTHEMDMILDGFKEGMTELRTELKEQKERYDTQLSNLKIEMDGLKTQISVLQNREKALMYQNTEQHNHIVYLEGHIPTPPGVPLRPEWTRIPTDIEQQEAKENKNND